MVVNNAGVVRDRMFANTTEDEWDAVMAVHLKGHFAVAASRRRPLAGPGQGRRGRRCPHRQHHRRAPGSMGSIGQAAYSAAKGGIASLTLVQAAELGRYGVTANAIAPSARTRMTERRLRRDDGRPRRPMPSTPWPRTTSSPLVVWLGSPTGAGVTGRVFEVEGGKVGGGRRLAPRPARRQGRPVGPRRAGRRGGQAAGRGAGRPSPVYGAG